MNVEILGEAGYDWACYALTKCRKGRLDRMPTLIERLAFKENGEGKVLRFVVMAIDVTAPLGWWRHFDTYKFRGELPIPDIPETLSETSGFWQWEYRQKHKIDITEADFEGVIPYSFIERLNSLLYSGNHTQLITELPQSFLQERVIICNYNFLNHIICQRIKHKALEWREFCKKIIEQIEHPELLIDRK